MSDPADWEALARYVAGESPPHEVERLETRFAAQPADKALLDALATLTQRMAASVPANLDVEAALQQVKARRSEPIVRPLELGGRPAPTDRRRIRWLVPMPGLAAAALLTIGIAGYLRLRTGNVEQPVSAVAPARMVATGVGAIDSLRLSDGTRVVLGPLSSINIAKGYGTESREVDVRGDAYFEVVHDSSKPFMAHAFGATIQDLGTKFTVRTDAAEGVAVSVSEGSVSLQSTTQAVAGTRGVVLQPGERGVVMPDGQTAKRSGAGDDMAWLRGQLVFREAPVTEVASSLHRWYGIDLRVPDASLASRHITATFSGEPPERVLEVIRLALGARLERRGDTAIVTRAKGAGGSQLK